jgi:hypothetical protein
LVATLEELANRINFGSWDRLHGTAGPQDPYDAVGPQHFTARSFRRSKAYKNVSGEKRHRYGLLPVFPLMDLSEFGEVILDASGRQLRSDCLLKAGARLERIPGGG